jgi:hypothetical protein
VFTIVTLASLLLTPFELPQGEDRDAKVRNDRKAFEGSTAWIYNDLEDGIRVARAAGRPVLVVFRCIPCEACQQFDDDVARRDPVIRDLLELYVCVRIPQGNAIDLTRFQFDFDQSFAVVLMNPDGTIYGRFGTRSQRPEREDISLLGLRAALAEALHYHSDYERYKPLLVGKQVRQSRYKTPLDYPSLSTRYPTTLDYAGSVAKSCVHCHQIRDAERLVYRETIGTIPDEVLYPYPDPGVLGLAMDPREKATVLSVAQGSAAEEAGLRVGDEIDSLEGQPLLSIADLQWVFHNARSTAHLVAQVRRAGKPTTITINLKEGWRRGDISWRTTTWDLRRMALGGMRLDALTEPERGQLGAPEAGMALRVRHVGQFGDHARAKQAGIEQADIIVGFDGLSGRMTESDLLGHLLQKRRPGDEVAVELLRFGQKRTVRLLIK